MMSKLAQARISQLELLRDRHLSRAIELERFGLPVSANRETQAAAAVEYRLAVIKRKLTELEYVRQMGSHVFEFPTDSTSTHA